MKTVTLCLSACLLQRLYRGGKRFMIVGLWGEYILKPQTEQYPSLPENEDLTMHLASLARIKTVPHSLIRFQDGSLAYITKRIDHDKKNGKIPMEDIENVYDKFRKVIPEWLLFIDSSFLPDEMKELYKTLIQEKCKNIIL